MKLVRDKIPEIIELEGKKCSFINIEHTEFPSFLYEKMIEELDEFIQEPSVEEAADIMEVFGAILSTYDISWCDVAQYATKKAYERGKFEKGIILLSVSEK